MNQTETSHACVHVHAPWPTDRKLGRLMCPTCERRTFFVGWFVEWYGWSMTCLRCGEQFEDGEQTPRPFLRGWRKKNVERAKARWRRGS